MYYFIEGRGWMIVDGTRIDIEPGLIIRTLDGAQRGVEAETRLIFLGTHSKRDSVQAENHAELRSVDQ